MHILSSSNHHDNWFSLPNRGIDRHPRSKNPIDPQSQRFPEIEEIDKQIDKLSQYTWTPEISLEVDLLLQYSELEG